MATIKDIAKHSGYSTATVVQVLGNRSHLFKPETRRRVLETAETLGYRPNHFGKALKSGRSMTIGLVTDATTSPLSLPRIIAAEDAARDQGYLTCLVNTNPSHVDIIRCVDQLLERRVDGLILFYSPPMASELAQVHIPDDVPVVYLYGAPPGARAWVQVDLSPAMAQVAQHLADLGHRRGLYVASYLDGVHPDFRINPYRRAFAAAGMELVVDERWRHPPNETVQTRGESRQARAYRLVQQMLAELNPLPTVLVMNNDNAATAALAALAHAGLRVPEDISVVGFDDTDNAPYLQPALTTVRHPRGEVGQMAFKMLHRMMGDSKAQVEPVAFTCELIVRDSTGPAAR